MLESLFGNTVIEKVLFYLLNNKGGYGAEMSRNLNTSLYSVQLALDRLERGGVVVRQPVGRTMVYMLNPRFPFLDELKLFLGKAFGALPPEKQKIYKSMARKRPRRRGKPL